MLCTSCPGLCLEAAGMVMLHGAGTELKCGWRDVTGLFLDVVEDSKNFIRILKALTSWPGTEVAVSEKVPLRPLWGKIFLFQCLRFRKAVERKEIAMQN